MCVLFSSNIHRNHKCCKITLTCSLPSKVIPNCVLISPIESFTSEHRNCHFHMLALYISIYFLLNIVVSNCCSYRFYLKIVPFSCYHVGFQQKNCLSRLWSSAVNRSGRAISEIPWHSTRRLLQLQNASFLSIHSKVRSAGGKILVTELLDFLTMCGVGHTA